MHAKQVHFLYVGLRAQLARQTIGFGAQRAHVVALTGERVDIDVDVAELVVREGALYARGKAGFYVVELAAHLTPRLRHVGASGVVLQLDEDQRLAGTRRRLQDVQAGGFLEFLFDSLGQFHLDFARRGARPQRAHYHDLEREVRVLGTTEAQEGQRTADNDDDDEVEHHRWVLKRPGGKIDALHGAAIRSFSPAVSLKAPAATMISPSARPAFTTAPSSLKLATSMARNSAVCSLPITQTAGLPFC